MQHVSRAVVKNVVMITDTLLAASPASFLTDQHDTEVSALWITQQLCSDLKVAEIKGSVTVDLEECFVCAQKLLQLLSKVLLARRGLQDWLLKPYCSCVGGVLAACRTVMLHKWGMRATVSAIISTPC